MAEAVCWNDETTPMRRESSHSDFVSSRVIDSPADMMIIYFELRLTNLHIQDLHFGLTDTDITQSLLVLNDVTVELGLGLLKSIDALL